MKRYKDCELLCKKEQSSMELLDIIERVSQKKGYTVERYRTREENDSLVVYMKKKSLPYSRLTLTLNNKVNSVKIVNIIPMRESGLSQIGYTEYNKLLEIYRDDVFVVIKNQDGNVIEENSEDYTIGDIISSRSVEYLERWLEQYPLSGHPLDNNRWYDFVINLHLSGDHLSTSDFEKYIEEACGWDTDDVSRFSSELESYLDLLEYYDKKGRFYA